MPDGVPAGLAVLPLLCPWTNTPTGGGEASCLRERHGGDPGISFLLGFIGREHRSRIQMNRFDL